MPRRVLQGTVVSNKANKTITVLVERRVLHPLYKKYVRSSKKYAAHDELNSAAVGDVVQIQECRPISKSKRWVYISKVAADGAITKVAGKVTAKAKAAK